MRFFQGENIVFAHQALQRFGWIAIGGEELGVSTTVRHPQDRQIVAHDFGEKRQAAADGGVELGLQVVGHR